MKVHEVMTSDPVVCTFSCAANVVARAMAELDFGIMPVVQDLASRRLMGVITDRDLALRVVADSRAASYITAQECMTSHPIACEPEDDVERVLFLMSERQLRRIPVVDKQFRVIGIVSIGDLVQQDAVTARDLLALMERISETKAQVAAKAA